MQSTAKLPTDTLTESEECKPNRLTCIPELTGKESYLLRWSGGHEEERMGLEEGSGGGGEGKGGTSGDQRGSIIL